MALLMWVWVVSFQMLWISQAPSREDTVFLTLEFQQNPCHYDDSSRLLQQQFRIYQFRIYVWTYQCIVSANIILIGYSAIAVKLRIYDLKYYANSYTSIILRNLLSHSASYYNLSSLHDAILTFFCRQWSVTRRRSPPVSHGAGTCRRNFKAN
jgi:hypothetical protein